MVILTLVFLDLFVDEEMHFVPTVDKTQTDRYLQILALRTLLQYFVLLHVCQSNMFVFIGAIFVHCVT